MKRTVFFLAVLAWAAFLFSSCNKTYSLGPLPVPTFTPTFTPTPTPACGFWNPNVTSTPTPTGVWTPVPTFCFNCQAPVTTFSYYTLSLHDALPI